MSSAERFLPIAPASGDPHNVGLSIFRPVEENHAADLIGPDSGDRFGYDDSGFTYAAQAPDDAPTEVFPAIKDEGGAASSNDETQEFVPPADRANDHLPAEPLFAPGEDPDKSNKFVEGAKNVASKAFRAPGYLTRKLSQAAGAVNDVVNNVTGSIYVKTRYSTKVDAAINTVNRNPSETGVATPAVFMLAGKIGAGVAQLTGINLPDIEISVPNPLDLLDQNKPEKPQVPAEAAQKTQGEKPVNGQGAIDTAKQAPAPGDPIEPHVKKGGDTPDTIKADSGEGAIKVTERIFNREAEHAGSDLRADDLTDKQFDAIRDAFEDDKGNKGDFYGEPGSGLMNEDTAYDTTDAKAVSDKLLSRLDPEANVYDGTPAPGEQPAAPAEKPAAPSAPAAPAVSAEAVQEAAKKAADIVTEAAEKSYEENRVKEPNIFERGWDATTETLSDWNKSVEAFGNRYGREIALGGMAIGASMAIGFAAPQIRRDVKRIWNGRKNPPAPITEAEYEEAVRTGRTIEEVVGRNDDGSVIELPLPRKAPSKANTPTSTLPPAGALCAATLAQRLANEEKARQNQPKPVAARIVDDEYADLDLDA